MRWQIVILALALTACKEQVADTGQTDEVLARLAARTAADGRPVVPPLPSGIAAGLQEIIHDVKPDGQFTYYRFRFVAPGLVAAPPSGLEQRVADMEFLCTHYALVAIGDDQSPYDKIVVSMADRETDFGVATPDATQFFESFRVENGVCIWEDF